MIATRPVLGSTPSRRQRGFTMVELMVGITLGLLVLAVATIVFVNVSNNRRDTERVGRQIENGRYAVQLLADDLVNAGYFGEFISSGPDADALDAIPDPCLTDLPVLRKALRMHVQGYGPAAAKPGCISDVKANTSVIVVRRVATCVAGAVNCAALTAGEIYFQTSLCNDSNELSTNPQSLPAEKKGFYFVAAAPGPFPWHKRDCVTPASLRKYEVHIYFVANNNNAGDGIPTLKRAELTGGAFTIVPLVEGIENLQVEYGLDTDRDSVPNTLTAGPATIDDWMNAVTARVHVLARTTEPNYAHTDVKTFNLGTDEAGNPITVGPFNDNLKRHAYSQTVRMNNPAGRRE